MARKEQDWRLEEIAARPADVFISYKRSDRPKIAALAKALETLGLDVWYDITLKPGDVWDEMIDAQANAARTMVVCWTPACFAADDEGWVRREAQIGLDRGVLAPIALHPVKAFSLPSPWVKVQTEDMSHWFSLKGEGLSAEGAHGALDDPGFLRLLTTLGGDQYLARKGLAPLAKVHAALAGLEPTHAGQRAALQKAVEAGREWILAFGEDPGAARLARTMVDYEYAALGARLSGEYGRPLGDWTPPGAEAMQRERLQLFEIDRLRNVVSARDAHIGQLEGALDRAAEAGEALRAAQARADETEAAARAAKDDAAKQMEAERAGSALREMQRAEELNRIERATRPTQAAIARIRSTGSPVPAPKPGERWIEARVLKGHGTRRDYVGETGGFMGLGKREKYEDRPAPVMCAAFSPDGTQIVTASHDKTARIWDAASGAVLATLSGHSNWVQSAAFSPDGSRIVTASYDKTARIWDAASGAELATLSGHSNWVQSAAFSPDGTRIVTANLDTTALIWDAALGVVLATLSGHSNRVQSAAFSPDGTRIVTASWDKTARIWDAASGAALSTLSGHSDSLQSAAFSPDGSRIATASSDTTARIWDAASGAALETLSGHSDWVRSAAFNPDGSRIITASYDRTARIWDAASGTELATLSGHEKAIISAAFSPDGRLVVTASHDNTARIWRLEA